MNKVLEVYKCVALTVIALCLVVGTQHVTGTVNLGGTLNPVEVKGKVDVGIIENPVTTRGTVTVWNDSQHPIPVQGNVDVKNRVSVSGSVDVDNTVSVDGSVNVDNLPTKPIGFGKPEDEVVKVQIVGIDEHSRFGWDTIPVKIEQ